MKRGEPQIKVKVDWKEFKHRVARSYILDIAFTLLQKTFPYIKDKKGYTFPDAWLFKDLLEREYLTDENIEWIRRSLLKYEKQIKALGYDYNLLEKIRISDKAIYYKRISPEVKLISVTVIAENEQVKVYAKYRTYEQRKRELIYATFNREHFIKLLQDSGHKMLANLFMIEQVRVTLDSKAGNKLLNVIFQSQHENTLQEHDKKS